MARSSLFGSAVSSVFSGLGSIGSLLLSQFMGLSKSEREQNQFNADQAQLNRGFQSQMQTQQNAFNASEAEKARSWTALREDTQYQRTVADMRAAGINPALAMNNGPIGASAAAPASAGSAPSGSAASGSGGGRASLSEILQAAQMAKQLKLVDAQIANVKSDTSLNDAHALQVDAQTKGQQLSNSEASIRLEYMRPLSDAQLASLHSQLDNDKVRRALDQSGISLNEASRLLTLQNIIAASIDNDTRFEMNRVELRLRNAQVINTYQSTRESRARVKTLEAEAQELYQRCLLHAANANVADEQSRYIFEQTGLLKYDAEKKQFEVRYQKADRVWKNTQMVFGMIRDFGIGVNGIAGAVSKFIPSSGSISGNSSSLFLPRSFNEGGMLYGVR